MIWGGVTALGGIGGEGQSERGINSLRRSLIKLFSPLSIGGLSLLCLLIITYVEQNPLAIFVQGIAPLSALTWSLWSHYTADEIEPGQMFEALVPLAPPNQSDQRLKRAKEVANQAEGFHARAITLTALAAVSDEQEAQDTHHQPLKIDTLASLLRDAVRQLHLSTRQFPLSQELTLADWMFEGQRLGQIWSKGLKRMNRGRSLLNPLILLSHKKLWSWSKGHPSILFSRELTVWLNYGVYLLVAERLREQNDQQNQTNIKTQSSIKVPHLWSMLSRKIAVPMWLYWSLCSVAITLSHGLLGLGLSLISGALLWNSLRRVTSIERWRDELCSLGALQRTNRLSEVHLTKAAYQAVDDAMETLKSQRRVQPLVAALTFAQTSAYSIAYTYRREDTPQPPAALLNATVVDALHTMELTLDDLIKWYQEGGVFPNILKLCAYFGGSEDKLDAQIFSMAKAWAHADSMLSLTTEEERANENELTLMQRAQEADQWLSEQLEDLHFILKAAAEGLIGQLNSSICAWIKNELLKRALPLYQGAVGLELPPSSSSGERKS